ncbi:T9SS type A sorting domain-containing protein [Brumimicrobium glaciale]|uniref:T9SS type A sorting domain-containing protein n=1 Tax=Brumimicrobium glaciale TaxID=200475 RepID=A0A4Q4KNL5_9FLAO|nr:T9SS type A sorting domain-containing protein [Brumimicrobium glaciale]RYM33519.1 T9SS type A sorting domain-containing protein [Brumimicrobium glaciale]
MPDANTVGVGVPFFNINTVAGHVEIYKFKGVYGAFYNDMNVNCIRDEMGVVFGLQGVIQPGSIIVQSNVNGNWYIDSLPAGTYTITIDTNSHWQPTCNITQSFTITDPELLTEAPSFGMISSQLCPDPDVSIEMPFIRPGFSDQRVYVQACNDNIATGALTNAYVDIELDNLITVDNASLPYINLGNNIYRFDVGTLNPGTCVKFNISNTISTSAVLGQTLCLEANLFPIEGCTLDSLPAAAPADFTPCSLPWDESSIVVEGKCLGDSIFFAVTNTGVLGNGDMDCFSPVRLYIDGAYIWLDSLQLVGGETFTYGFSADGRTWRLEVDQHPEHPGLSAPNATIELCGDIGNWTPDLVNIFPMDDADPNIDIFCGTVTGSYDPNDKRGLPFGLGNDHLIKPNGQLQYRIRFQNTGTDTAFTVKIIDTIEQDLNIFSVTPGVSSHDYVFRVHGSRVLEWTYNNILLPDSNTNEPESNGFLTFTVNQVKGLSNGTEINNFADIYFDFNSPIRTDTTSHTVDRQIKTAGWTEEKEITDEACDEYGYNGLMYFQTGIYYQIIEGIAIDTLVKLNLSINKIQDLDLNVSQVGNVLTSNDLFASYQWIDCNKGNFPINGETNQSFTANSNRDYAVILTVGSCIDTSDCVNISNVGLKLVNNLTITNIYPNPSKGSFTIELGEDHNNTNFTVKNVLGKTVYTATKNGNKVKIQLNESKGIYFVNIQTEKGEFAIFKLIVE